MKKSNKERVTEPEAHARRDGKSHYRFEDGWYEEEFTNAIVSDTKISIDIPQEGQTDTVLVTARSTDNGNTYIGTYQYLRQTEEDGQVEFRRYRGKSGDVFKGHWVPRNGVRDLWFIEVYPFE